MGACYSSKAGGGKYSYTTLPMASTKIDDTSCISRPTPYSRNLSSSPTIAISSKKGIPISNRPERTLYPNSNANKFESPNSKSPNAMQLQSSIPRFNSNTPTPLTTKAVLNENLVNANTKKDRNENTSLNVMNNNCVPSSHSESNVTNIVPKSDSIKETESPKPGKISSSCPDDMSSHARESHFKFNFSKIPAKFGFKKSLPSATSSPLCKSARIPSPSRNTDPIAVESNLRYGPTLNSTSNARKPEQNGKRQQDSDRVSVSASESHDSFADSGIGTSFTEKPRQDDADTLKDLDWTESDTSPVGNNKAFKQIVKSEEKPTLKCPTYKRGLNGKWSVYAKEDHSSLLGQQTTSQGPSYASYKSLMSYKKCFVKPAISPQKDKTLSLEKSIITKPLLKSLAGDSPAKDQKYQESKTVKPASTNSSQQTTPESDDKSEGIGSGSDTKSPPSEVENREFFDDEISDQPTLISCTNDRLTESPLPSLQQSVTELHALQLSSTARKNSDLQGIKSYRERLGSDHRDSLLLSSEMGSSCSSIASDDLMLDFDKKIDLTDITLTDGTLSPMRTSFTETDDDQITALGTMNSEDRNNRKRLLRRASGSGAGVGPLGKEERRLRSVSLPLRPPRPMSVTETDDGSIILDSSSYRLLSQDLTGVKTLLLRLKSVIQEAETINPFDIGNTKNIFYSSLAHGDFPSNLLSRSEDQSGKQTVAGLSLENADLRRQLVLLHQQMDEKDRTILLLQHQMTKYTNSPSLTYESIQSANAATQTERPKLMSSLSSSAAGSSETLVSGQHAFEELVNERLEENFPNQFEEVSRSWNSLNQNVNAAAKSTIVKRCSSMELS